MSICFKMFEVYDKFTLVIQAIILFANLFSHIVVIYLILVIQRYQGPSIHFMYILNLIFSELGIIILELLSFSLRFAVHNTKWLGNITHHCFMISVILFMNVLFTTMAFILFNKLLEIMMNLRYYIFCDPKKVKVLIFTFWVLGTVLCVITLTAHHLATYEFHNVYILYQHLPSFVLFIVFAVPSYIYLFYKLNKSRLLPHDGLQKYFRYVPSFYKVFRRSQIFLPVLITLSFVFLHVIPHGIVMLYEMTNTEWPPSLHIYFQLSFDLMMICNALICILLEPRVQRQIKRIKRNRLQSKMIMKRNDKSIALRTPKE